MSRTIGFHGGRDHLCPPRLDYCELANQGKTKLVIWEHLNPSSSTVHSVEPDRESEYVRRNLTYRMRCWSQHQNVRRLRATEFGERSSMRACRAILKAHADWLEAERVETILIGINSDGWLGEEKMLGDTADGFR